VGASRNPAIEGISPLRGVANFFLGNDPAAWHTNLPTYEAVRYGSLYPGIDLVYRGTQGQLKSEFLVSPGADPSRIRLVYWGAQGLKQAQDGSLIIHTPLGDLVEAAPEVYQIINGVKRLVPGGYRLAQASVRLADGFYRWAVTPSSASGSATTTRRCP